MTLKFIIAVASLISAIYAAEVCQKNFYIEVTVDMFGECIYYYMSRHGRLELVRDCE